MNQRTALFARHEAAGARIVDFHGWDMPVHYGSQIAEHKAVRESAGVFDVSHMTVVDVAGPGARDFLRNLLSNDVDRLGGEGRALYTTMLNDEGGIIDDLIVYRMKIGYRLVVNCGTREKDLAWMRGHLNGFDCELAERPELAIVAVQGPESGTLLAAAHATGMLWLDGLRAFEAHVDGETLIARTGYTGELGYELILPEDAALRLWDGLIEAGVQPSGLGARDTLRLEAGLNLYGNDMDETVTPWESGIAFAVSLTERDFIGRDALLAQRERGVQRRLVGVVLEGRGVMRAGAEIVVNARRAGHATSGAFSPTLGHSIALARLDHTDGAAEVVLRGRKLPVEIVKPPFVRNNTRAYRAL